MQITEVDTNAITLNRFDKDCDTTPSKRQLILSLNKVYYIVVINEYAIFAYSKILRANKITTTFRLQSLLYDMTFLVTTDT